MNQRELPLFCTHSSGGVTHTFLTLALYQTKGGDFELFLTMEPSEPESRRFSFPVTSHHSVRHQLDMALAEMSGRLVRDFTRLGRTP